MGVSVAKVMCVCVCGLRARGEGTDIQDPLEVVNASERRSRGCVQSDDYRQELHAGILVAVWELV